MARMKTSNLVAIGAVLLKHMYVFQEYVFQEKKYIYIYICMVLMFAHLVFVKVILFQSNLRISYPETYVLSIVTILGTT